MPVKGQEVRVECGRGVACYVFESALVWLKSGWSGGSFGTEEGRGKAHFSRTSCGVEESATVGKGGVSQGEGNEEWSSAEGACVSNQL